MLKVVRVEGGRVELRIVLGRGKEVAVTTGLVICMHAFL